MSRRFLPGAALDRLAARTACRLLAWSAARVEGNERAWLDALAAELGEFESGGAQLLWAAGGLRLVWRGERRQLVGRAYRFSPVLVIVLGVALFVWLAFSIAQQYVWLALGLGVLTGIGVLVAVPTLIALVRACVKLVSRRLAARHADQRRLRRMWSRLALVVGSLCLVSLVGLGLALNGAVDQMLAQGPATAGVVASAADRGAVEAALRQLPGMARQDVYLTTLVKPLSVNGMPLAEVAPGPPLCPPKSLAPNCRVPTRTFAQVVQGVADKFTSIQGFDLAHGHLPDITNFDDGAGSNGPGYNQIIGPRGRRLAASDANTYNVMIAANCPHAACPDYRPVNGDLVSVQNLVTGQIVQLRIVGQYYVEDGQPIPLFGMVLADDSVVRLLTGGAPSYAYGLRIGATQRQTLFAQLRAVAPAAQLYDFTRLGSASRSVPGYTDFTDPFTAELAFAPDQAGLEAGLIGEVALLAALLASIFIVASWEIRALARARRTLSAAPGT
jgi:hypothetical protein